MSFSKFKRETVSCLGSDATGSVSHKRGGSGRYIIGIRKVYTLRGVVLDRVVSGSFSGNHLI